MVFLSHEGSKSIKNGFFNGINDKSNESVYQEFKIFEKLELNQNSILQMWKFEIATSVVTSAWLYIQLISQENENPNN